MKLERQGSSEIVRSGRSASNSQMGERFVVKRRDLGFSMPVLATRVQCTATPHASHRQTIHAISKFMARRNGVAGVPGMAIIPGRLSRSPVYAPVKIPTAKRAAEPAPRPTPPPTSPPPTARIAEPPAAFKGVTLYDLPHDSPHPPERPRPTAHRSRRVSTGTQAAPSETHSGREPTRRGSRSSRSSDDSSVRRAVPAAAPRRKPVCLTTYDASAKTKEIEAAGAQRRASLAAAEAEAAARREAERAAAEAERIELYNLLGIADDNAQTDTPKNAQEQPECSDLNLSHMPAMPSIRRVLDEFRNRTERNRDHDEAEPAPAASEPSPEPCPEPTAVQDASLEKEDTCSDTTSASVSTKEEEPAEANPNDLWVFSHLRWNAPTRKDSDSSSWVRAVSMRGFQTTESPHPCTGRCTCEEFCGLCGKFIFTDEHQQNRRARELEGVVTMRQMEMAAIQRRETEERHQRILQRRPSYMNRPDAQSITEDPEVERISYAKDIQRIVQVPDRQRRSDDGSDYESGDESSDDDEGSTSDADTPSWAQ